MPRMKLFVVAVVLITLAFGTTARAQESDELTGTTWVLISLNETELVEGSSITLNFGNDGSISGAAGCNSYSADYTLNGHDIRFGVTVSTLMACLQEEVMAQESAYLDALESVTSYELTDGQLILTYGNGEQLVFEQGITLPNTSWQLQRIGENDVTGTLTLMFDEDGRIVGSSGCNTFSSAYTIDGTMLSVDSIRSTRAVCPEETGREQESAYYNTLESADSFEIMGEQLTITGENSERLVFTLQKALADTRWMLVSLGGSDVIAETVVTLEFSVDGEAHGSTGCNQFGTTYGAEEGRINFDESIVTTRRACLSERITEQEQAYLAALASATTYTLEDDQLLITYDDGEMIFERMMALANTSWQLSTINGDDVAAETGVTLSFDDQGNISGSGGCNEYGGIYLLDGGILTISQLESTERACLESAANEQEQAYFEALNTITGYELTADTLTITYGEGQQLIFTPQATSTQ